MTAYLNLYQKKRAKRKINNRPATAPFEGAQIKQQQRKRNGEGNGELTEINRTIFC